MCSQKRRNYLVWFDLYNMKGSVMVSTAGSCAAYTAGPNQLLSASVCAQDAMSEAVEGAELMLYGVSEKYKER